MHSVRHNTLMGSHRELDRAESEYGLFGLLFPLDGPDDSTSVIVVCLGSERSVECDGAGGTGAEKCFGK